VPGHSFTVMQAWSKIDDNYLLVDQWRAQAELDEIISALTMALRVCRPSAVLIEQTGFGQALARDVQRRFSRTRIKLISPDGRSKTARLLSHLALIEGCRICLAQDASWRDAFVEEFVQFPNGAFDDQVDALTMAMDFFVENQTLEPLKSRALGGVLNSHSVFTPASKMAASSIQPANVFSRSGPSRATIFPRPQV
jgi:predicted phage terminase large subunit-like protein